MRATAFVDSYIDAWNHCDPKAVADHLTADGIYCDIPINEQSTHDELVTNLTTAMADRLLQADGTRKARINRLFLEAYGRQPTADELDRADVFLTRFAELVAQDKDETKGGAGRTKQAWQALCQSVVSSSEFIYVR